MNAGHSRRRSAQSRAPEADPVSDVIGVKIENRTNILEREVWLAVPALDPLLGLPAEQTGREIPGVLAFSETSNRIRENRKRQSHFARLCATTRQRLHRAGPIRILALRRSLALKIHHRAPPESLGFAAIKPAREARHASCPLLQPSGFCSLSVTRRILRGAKREGYPVKHVGIEENDLRCADPPCSTEHVGDEGAGSSRLFSERRPQTAVAELSRPPSQRLSTCPWVEVQRMSSFNPNMTRLLWADCDCGAGLVGSRQATIGEASVG